MMWRALIASALLPALAGCSLFKQADHFEATPITYNELSGWNQENHEEALQVFNRSCDIMARRASKPTALSNITISPAVWEELCAKSHASLLDAKNFFEQEFLPYRISNNRKEQGLFTGYYEPVLYGSLTKTGDYKYPVYKTPPDLKKPYFTRAQIDQGALAGRGLELAWVDDPVMLFFMQIQGSGRIRLDNGQEFIAGYAEQNGHQYETIGKIMGAEGMLPKDQINFFTIRQWLYDHPDQAFALMQRNPSWVFFKKLDRERVVGSIGAELTPKRSLAIDHKHIPYGLPLYLETKLPSLPGVPEHPFNRLMIAQDTGGAIRSPVRGDIFFGGGQEAEYLAGYMKNKGVYTLLMPRAAASQLE